MERCGGEGVDEAGTVMVVLVLLFVLVGAVLIVLMLLPCEWGAALTLTLCTFRVSLQPQTARNGSG